MAEGGGLAVGELVQGGLGDVEAGGGVVDGEDVDGAPAVAQLPASSALKGEKSALLFTPSQILSEREMELTLAEFQPAISAAPPT